MRFAGMLHHHVMTMHEEKGMSKRTYLLALVACCIGAYGCSDDAGGGSVTNVCDNVDCTENGVCVSSSTGPVCVCFGGFTSARLDDGSPTCTASGSSIDEGPCAGVTCDGHGRCVVGEGDVVSCVCDNGYEQGDSVTSCVAGADSPCKDVTCDEHGKCIVASDNTAYCSCDKGYENGEATTCVPEADSPCKDVTCDNHGKCIVTSDNAAYCACEAGYVLGTTEDGVVTCVESAPSVNACEGIDCAGHGVCLIAGDNSAFCACEAGYQIGAADGKVTCLEVTSSGNLCDGVTCGGYGQCITTTSGVACLCMSGYKDVMLDGGTPSCIKQTQSSACDGITCGDHGDCLVTEYGTARCACDEGYKVASVDRTPVCISEDETSPCDGITCSGHGACDVALNGVAYCLCDAGYKTSVTNGVPVCVESTETSACDGVSCGSNGLCIVKDDNAPYCICGEGNKLVTTIDGKPSCVEESKAMPCDNVTCNNHGTCAVSNDMPVCVCDEGYKISTDGKYPTCIAAVAASPCDDVTCSDHGQCLVTTDHHAYCLCDASYKASSENGLPICVAEDVESKCDSETCDNGVCAIVGDTPRCVCKNGYHNPAGEMLKCEADVVKDPCEGVTCNDHGVCVVSGSSPFCVCEAGYRNESYTVCSKAPVSTGASGGEANGGETIDPWGLVWDTTERAAKTHLSATLECERAGGRLPNSTELWRNNHKNGAKGVGTDADGNYLWAKDVTTGAQAERRRLSDGEPSPLAYTSKSNFRCVWDPEELDTFTHANCNGAPGKDGCAKVAVGNVTYVVDAKLRPAENWSVAAQQCRDVGARLPTLNELIMISRAELDSASAYQWTTDTANTYNTTYNDKTRYYAIYKWDGVVDRTYQFSSSWSYTAYSNRQQFRCISEQVDLTTSKPYFPQTKAMTAFEVSPVLRIDEKQRAAKTVFEAEFDCMKDGGRLASLDEMQAALRAELIPENEAWQWTRSNYAYLDGWTAIRSYGYSVVKWNTQTQKQYWDFAANTSYADYSASYAYRCTYRPARAFDDKGSLDEAAKDGTLFKYEQKLGSNTITHYADAKDRPATGNVITNAEVCADAGLLLPTESDLVFMIRNGLKNGTNAYLRTSSVSTWLGYHGFLWSGTGTSSYAPQNYVNWGISWNASQAYRSYISSVIY